MINYLKYNILILIFLFYTSILYAQTKISYTFKDLGILEEDLVFYGTSIDYDFYIPNQPHLIEADLKIKLKILETLKEDYQLEIYLNNKPIQVLKKIKSNEIEIPLNIKRQDDIDVIKITIKGNFKIHKNICEDAFYYKPIAILQKESSIEFKFNPPKDIRTFLVDYNLSFCINDFNLLPIIYNIGRENFYKPNFYWGNYGGCKQIKISNENKLENNILYLDTNGIKSIQDGYIKNFFAKDIKVNLSKKEDYIKVKELFLRELGFTTKTIKGITNLSMIIPLDLTYLHGKPDKLFMNLIFSTNHPKDKDRLEIRIFINENLIHIIPIEKGGLNNVTFEIPNHLLSHGYNNLKINLINFLSSEDCLGSFNESVMTIYDHSYIYWNNIDNKTHTISSFFEGISGDVLLIIEEDKFIPLAVKLLGDLSFYKRNIENIHISENKKRGIYNHVIHFKKPTWDGNFEIYNPLTQKVLFSAKYSTPFLYIELDQNENKVNISYFGDIQIEKIIDNFKLRELYRLYGNVGVITEDYPLTFDVGKKNRIRYESEKNFSYYWNKHKLLFILFLGALIVTFLIYIYTKLTKRPI